jgi:hypothetical protein
MEIDPIIPLRDKNRESSVDLMSKLVFGLNSYSLFLSPAKKLLCDLNIEHFAQTGAIRVRDRNPDATFYQVH